MIARFRFHYWLETALEYVCNFGPVVLACCLADSSIAVGFERVLPVVARLLMKPINVWIPIFQLITMYVLLCQCALSDIDMSTHIKCIITHFCLYVCLSVRYRTIRMIVDSGPGSSVGIATELRAGRSGIESRWGWDFPPVQTGPEAHSASCKMGTGSFPGVKCGRSVQLTTYPLLVPRSWKSRAIRLPTLWTTPGL